MMRNRMIPFGYEIIGGQIQVVEYESNIVKQIFASYIDGKTLREIAEYLTDEKVKFSEDKSSWDKIRVSRLIANRKYLGENNYPIIIDDEIFDKANNLKNSKVNAKQDCLQEVFGLKGKVVCGQCGEELKRRGVWGAREKWLCRNGCKSEKYIDDIFLISKLNKIVERIINDASIINVKQPKFCGNQEILRCSNEISRIASSAQPSFAVGKKAIFLNALLKFNCCSENVDDATKFIVDETHALQDSQINRRYIDKLIDKIIIEKDGNIKVQFINGAVVDSRI